MGERRWRCHVGTERGTTVVVGVFAGDVDDVLSFSVGRINVTIMINKSKRGVKRDEEEIEMKRERKRQRLYAKCTNDDDVKNLLFEIICSILQCLKCRAKRLRRGSLYYPIVSIHFWMVLCIRDRFGTHQTLETSSCSIISLCPLYTVLHARGI